MTDNSHVQVFAESAISIIYHRRGKIRWDKHSRFQPYEAFRRNTFAVHWPPVLITYSNLPIAIKFHGKTSVVGSKTAKTVKV